MGDIVIRVLAALGGLGFLGTVTVAFMQRGKVKAEAGKAGADAAQVLTSTAMGMLTTVRAELSACRQEISALRHHVGRLEGALRVGGLPVPDFVNPLPVANNGTAHTST
jgi:hypothetical protein